MLDRLEAYKQTIPIKHAVPFVAAFLELGDDLPKDYVETLFSPEQHIKRIIYWYLMQEADQEKRSELFMKAVNASNGLYLVVSEAHSNDREENKRETPDKFLLDVANSKKLRDIALKRIVSAAESGTLIKHPQLQYLLDRWKKWGNPREPIKWLRKMIQTDEGIRKVLVAFLLKSTFYMSNDRVGKVHWKFDLRNLEDYIDADYFESRVDQLNIRTLNNLEQIALDRFKKMLKRKREGKPYGLDQLRMYNDE